MKIVSLCSPCAKVGGLVYFGRMVDQIRTHAKGELPAEYQANLGKGLDEHCVNFPGVSQQRRSNKHAGQAKENQETGQSR